MLCRIDLKLLRRRFGWVCDVVQPVKYKVQGATLKDAGMELTWNTGTAAAFAYDELGENITMRIRHIDKLKPY